MVETGHHLGLELRQNDRQVLKYHLDTAGQNDRQILKGSVLEK